LGAILKIGGYRSAAMETSEPSPGTSKERSDGNPDYEPDFTIANISRKGFDFQGTSRCEAILGRKISQ
jgi:hypothetical protein